MKRYKISGDKDGTQEFNILSNNRTQLLKKAKEYIEQGYFVFLIDTLKDKIVEIRI